MKYSILFFSFLSLHAYAQINTSLRYEGRLQGPTVTAGSMINQNFTVDIRRPDGCGGNLISTWTSGSVTIVDGAFTLKPSFPDSHFSAIMNPYNSFGGMCAHSADRIMRITWNSETFDVAINDAPRAGYANVAGAAFNTSAIGGVSVQASMTCANGQILKFNSSTTQFECSSLAAAEIPVLSSTNLPNAGGDLSGNLTNARVEKIQNTQVSNAAPNAGQVLKFDGVQWSPQTEMGLSNTTVNPGNYGSATRIPIFTVDPQGRLTSASDTPLNDTTKLSLTDYLADVAGAESCAGTETPYWNTVAGTWNCKALSGVFLTTGNNPSGSAALLGTNNYNDLNLRTNAIDRMKITKEGQLGFGNAAVNPASYFHSSFSTNNSTSLAAHRFDFAFTPSSSHSGQVTSGTQISMSTSNTNSVGTVQPLHVIHEIGPSGGVSSAAGVMIDVQRTSGSGTVSNLYGSRVIASNSGPVTNVYGSSNKITNSGTLSQAYGSFNSVTSTGGSVGTAFGTYSQVQTQSGTTLTLAAANRAEIAHAGNTLNNASAFEASFNSTGVINNGYAFRSNGVTATNAYGLFLAANTATNNYGVYQEDAAAKNYFAGSVKTGLSGSDISQVSTCRNTGTVLTNSTYITCNGINANSTCICQWHRSSNPGAAINYVDPATGGLNVYFSGIPTGAVAGEIRCVCYNN